MSRRLCCRLLRAARLVAFVVVSLAVPQASHAQSHLGDTSCGQLGQVPCALLSSESLDTGTGTGCDRGLKAEYREETSRHECVNNMRKRAQVNEWVANTLRLQRELQADLPINRLAVLGSHNAFNNISDGYPFTNQEFSITDQLNMGIRRLSLDVHYWFFSMRLCHATVDPLIGIHWVCSPQDRPLYQALEEVKQWMLKPENSQELVFIDFEIYLDFFGNGREQLLAPIQAHFSDLAYWQYRVDGSAAAHPTLDQIRDQGKRLIIMDRNEVEGNPYYKMEAKNGYPASKANRFIADTCQYKVVADGSQVADISPADHSTNKYIDFYEDTLFNDPENVGSIDSTTLKNMTACHVTHISLDKVTSDKLQSAIWSWDVNQPDTSNSDEDCAEMLQSGRWNDKDCNASRPFACLKTNSAGEPEWSVTSAQGPWREGKDRCKALGSGYEFSVPRTGHENKKLTEVTGGQGVWLNLHDSVVEGVWSSRGGREQEVELRSLGKCLVDPSDQAETGTYVQLRGCYEDNDQDREQNDEQKWILPGDGTIRSAIDTTQCLDLEGGSTNDGTRLLIRPCHSGANQRWIVDDAFLRSFLDRSKVVEVRYGNTADGASIQLRSYHGGPNQQWGRVKSQQVELSALGKCMEDTSGNATSGTSVKLWTCNGDRRQKWLVPGDGTIRSAIDVTQCLDLENGSAYDGASIQLWPCHGGNSQVWIVDGPVLRSFLNQSKVIDVKDGRAVDGTVIQLWGYNGGLHQQWERVRPPQAPEVELRAYGKCMDDTSGNASSGASVNLWACKSDRKQKWLLPGDGTIRSAFDPTRCLDQPGSTQDGARLQLWPCHSGLNQVWIVDGPFLRSALDRTKVINVKGGDTADGTAIQLWSYNGGLSQRWAQVGASP